MNKVIFYMPSIKSNGSKIVNRKRYLDDTLLLFADLFGGATSYNGNGSWKLSNGKLQVEPVTIIYSYVDKLTVKNKNKFINHAKKLKKELLQDSILIELENKPVFI